MSRLDIPFPAISSLRPSKCTFIYSISAIYTMRPFKYPFYPFHSPLFTQCDPPNVPFSYSIPRNLPNATLQTYRLAIPFLAVYPMHASKRPVLLFNSQHFTQRTPQHVPFSYSIPGYLPIAQLQTSHLTITFPAFTQCATPNVPFSYSIPRYLPNAPHQSFRLALPSPLLTKCAHPNVPFRYSIPAIYPMLPSKLPV